MILSDEARFPAEALLVLAGGYEALGHALVDAPVPARLPPDEQVRYRALLRPHAERAWTKAWQLDDLGLQAIGRLGGAAPLRDRLLAARDRVARLLEPSAP